MTRENEEERARGRGHAAPGNLQPLSVEVLLSDDPDLWLATGDMRAWSDAHPCECEAICECD
jgi:hypothetical protein